MSKHIIFLFLYLIIAVSCSKGEKSKVGAALVQKDIEEEMEQHYYSSQDHIIQNITRVSISEKINYPPVTKESVEETEKWIYYAGRRHKHYHVSDYWHSSDDKDFINDLARRKKIEFTILNSLSHN